MARALHGENVANCGRMKEDKLEWRPNLKWFETNIYGELPLIIRKSLVEIENCSPLCGPQ